jgi:hypothetical protein
VVHRANRRLQGTVSDVVPGGWEEVMFHIRLRLLTAGVAFALCACASTQRDAGFYDRSVEQTTVLVKNNYWSEMAIYIVTSGTRWRLGSVMGTSEASLPVPPDLLTGPDVHLQADPVGPDPAFMFPRFALRPGSKVQLNLEHTLRYSSFSVW